ncbi:MAG: DUF1150 family protein [Proteobacteria bacterium]|nr:DUF1150 family protein [Pseudomonadota bacterium]
MQNHDNSSHAHETARSLSPEAFAMLGGPQLAYVAPVTGEQGKGFGIFAANGNLLGVVASRELAFAAARQHELEAVSVH